MFQVMYEYEGAWPETEPLHVDGQFMGKTFSAVLQISPVDAKRKANNYLSNDVSTGIYADEPMLVWSDKPRWRLSLSLRLPMIETTELPGVIEIDAMTGRIIDISTNKLNFILEMADDIAKRLAPEPTPAS